jgi:hypothetical protein
MRTQHKQEKREREEEEDRLISITTVTGLYGLPINASLPGWFPTHSPTSEYAYPTEAVFTFTLPCNLATGCAEVINTNRSVAKAVQVAGCTQ